MDWDIYYNGSWIESFTMPNADVVAAKKYVADRYTQNEGSKMEISPNNASNDLFTVWG